MAEPFSLDIVASRKSERAYLLGYLRERGAFRASTLRS